MISPESFGRTHKRHATDVIRVALERKGVIGFIDIHESMSLLEARTLIWENVENAPNEFQFILEDGAPVSARQENTQKISCFYPCVKIRECKKARPSIGSPTKPIVSQSIGSPTASDSSEMWRTGGVEKVCVRTSSGEEFVTWISEEYTFQQLRQDAARYWNMPQSQVVLVDADGCLWPEQAKILSLTAIVDLHQQQILLEYKAGADVANATKCKNRTRPQMTTTMLSTSSRTSFRRYSAPGRYDSQMGAVQLATSETSAVKAVEELWRIFTFYCVNGDSLELECIKAHQFSKLLRDARLFGGNLTPAMADIVYTSETKGKQSPTGKMCYDEFLNALMKIAVTRQKPHKQLRSATEDEELFHQLVVDNILPRASRWPTHVWEEQTKQLRGRDIVSFVSKFVEPLMEIFMFYAKSHRFNTSTNVKEFYMSYNDYQKFVNDFYFANMPLSSVECAHVFLASCSSSPFYSGVVEQQYSGQQQDSFRPSSSLERPATPGTSSALSAIQRLLVSVEGVIAYSFPENQVGRSCMGFSAFLDVLGRAGIVAFSKMRVIKPLHCVKAVFHHLTRGLTRSRVLEILHNHGSSSIHAAKFYSGTVTFNNRFLDMWRYEGSPDYMTGSILNVPSKDPSPTTHSVATITRAASAFTHRPQGSANLLVDDRGNQASAGRGREALDRLARRASLQILPGSDESAAISNAKTKAANATGVRFADLPSRIDLDPRIERPEDSYLARESIYLADPDSSTSSILADGKSGLGLENPETNEPLFLNIESPTPETNIGDKTSGANGQLANTTMLQSPKPHSSGTLSREDSKVLYESILLKGGVFKKYGQWGNPHRRYVWCSKDFDAVYWRPVNKKQFMNREGIPVSGIISVLPGNSTRTRYAFMKHLSDGKSGT
ncbi:TPA: hypothetical protein N0F65_006377 [Lagenidium giganteum]|uniref:Uncharacterized protein n=1 Tax=Lagenidium giganteum TaxID=4803 RepID=A0AAV2YTE6_9STRA|nr:TPA: hypothetical protein N0F65_006377 [Lagenidium giganteum]